MSTYQNIRVETAEGIALVTIDRPDKLNALDRKTLEELSRAVRRVRDDGDVRAAIITGSGEKAFVAGADISEIAGLSDSLDAIEFSRSGQAVFSEIEASRKPIVAAVNGFALGGGCELALACHLRIASRNARFGQPEVKLGIIPAYGGTLRLPRIVGKGRALEIILSGEMISADEAYRIGLVNRVVEPEALEDECRTLLRTILANGPVAVALAIDATSRGLEMEIEHGMNLEANLFGLLATTDDMREGTAAFLEKRKAEFGGK
ncbi:MAG: enoyl-CoA hydratase-related protein [Gemmatimonadota bacterium]